jgi:phospholipid-binding lipoprotein MlaA
LLLDTQADLVFGIDGVPVHNSLYATRGISNRANLLDASSVIEQAALDKYTFVREAWLQRRRNLVHDGDPPREREDPDDEPTK